MNNLPENKNLIKNEEMPIEISRESVINKIEVKNVKNVKLIKNSYQILLFSFIMAIIFRIIYASFSHYNYTIFTSFQLIFYIGYVYINKLIKNKIGFIYLIPIILIMVGNDYTQGTFEINFIVNTVLICIFALKLTNPVFKNIIDLRIIFLPLIEIFIKFFINLYIISINLFRDFFKKGVNGNKSKIKKILKSILITSPIILIIIILLSQADPIFKEIFKLNYESKYIFNINFVLFSTLIFCPVLTGAVLVKEIQAKEKSIFKIDEIMINTFLVIICTIFFLFCFIQLKYLVFGGMYTLPNNLTYAEYAREGFFQLLFVSIINFICLFFIVSYTDVLKAKSTKILTLTLILFTFLLIGSSLYRMGLYINAYSLTALRIRVLLFLAMETIILIFATINIFKPKFCINKIVMFIMICTYLISIWFVDNNLY